MCDRKAVIKNADMSEEMQQDSVECATQALEKYNIEKDIAAHIKKQSDKKYNPTWHCIVGRNFGSYLTHETKHFIYFYLGQVAILLSDLVKSMDCATHPVIHPKTRTAT
ncbi:dynein light chain 1, cytoplasmic-like [Kogia breviceps]|uniref:dynein light chain 1, cytoplasmic-like n=1 Tax=Kogia breviceps TaxID=27615 RepID=UPI002795A36B|nr:dynein light chain 1, cytoplasmic-like [Kogia breviceps]